MGVSLLVELFVRIAHGLRLAAPEHHLEIDRREAVVLIAVNDPGRTGDAFPGAEPRGQALAAFVLDKDVEETLQHEEDLLDLMGVGRVALSGLHIHDGKRKVLDRNDRGIAVLAGTAGADEAMLGALVAFDLGILERRPIRLLLAEAADEFLHDVFDRHIQELRRTRVSCNAHGWLLRSIHGVTPRVGGASSTPSCHRMNSRRAQSQWLLGRPPSRAMTTVGTPSI